MKRETYEKKLAEILGLQYILSEKEQRAKKTNQALGVTEDEINNARQAQGIIYFFQAPDLFSAKTCPHCGEGFLVSRRFVAFCSYTCIQKSLEEKGIKWSRSNSNGYEISEEYIKNIYEGNEPIWIKNLDVIQDLLDKCKVLEAELA